MQAAPPDITTTQNVRKTSTTSSLKNIPVECNRDYNMHKKNVKNESRLDQKSDKKQFLGIARVIFSVPVVWSVRADVMTFTSDSKTTVITVAVDDSEWITGTAG